MMCKMFLLRVKRCFKLNRDFYLGGARVETGMFSLLPQILISRCYLLGYDYKLGDAAAFSLLQ